MKLFNNIFQKKQAPVRRVGSIAAAPRVNARASQVKPRGRALTGKAAAPKVADQVRAFEMAKLERTTNDWITLGNSVNWDIRWGNPAIRARAREMRFNDPYASRYIEQVKKNIVGVDGFIFKNKAFDWRQMDGQMQKVFDKVANGKIEDAFWEWNKKQYCSLTEELFFNELLQLIIATVATDGEIFIRKIKNSKINKFGYTLQLIEADHVDEKLSRIYTDGSFIDMGIRYTQYKKPVSYLFKKAKNYEYEDLSSITAFDYEEIPASEVIHLFIKETPSQRRGLSWFLPAALRLHMLKGFEDASLINARAAACKTGIIQAKEGTRQQVTGDDEDADGNVIFDLNPNEIFKVPYGYEWLSHTPAFPHEQHMPFTKTILRGGASGLKAASYINLANDYEGTSYSSGRLSLNDEHESWKILQGWFINHFLMNFIPEWLEMAMLSGMVALPMERFDKFNQPNFYGRRWEYLDPVKDANADILAFENNLKTLEQIHAERGSDYDEVIQRIALEKQQLKDLGILPQAKGALAPAEPQDTEEEAEDGKQKVVKNKNNGRMVHVN